MANEARFHHQSVHNECANARMCGRWMHRAVGRCFPFTSSRKIAVEGSFILGDLNWKLLPCGHPHRHEYRLQYLHGSVQKTKQKNESDCYVAYGRTWEPCFGWQQSVGCTVKSIRYIKADLVCFAGFTYQSKAVESVCVTDFQQKKKKKKKSTQSEQ